MSSVALRFVVSRTGPRLDRLVADATGRGRRTVRQWFLHGRVRVDGHVAQASDSPEAGCEVVVAPDDSAPEAGQAPLPLPRILHEDRCRVILAKPAGLHCERGKSRGSVAEFLEERYGDCSGIGARPEEAGLVHRLDRDTSGVLVAARDAGEYRYLRDAFREGATLKQYLALAVGPLEQAIEVDLPLARRGSRMTEAGPHDDALPALTLLEPLEAGPDWCLVLATMRTGVMHQVRVHMALAGYPLLGDSLYGGPSLPGCSRQGQLLHALRVQVEGDIDVTVGPPEDFLEACAALRRGGD